MKAKPQRRKPPQPQTKTNTKVHDIGGRVGKVVALLKSKGFARAAAWQEPRFAACNLHMVYAVR
jgi:hypothetical protein